jgi:hypothetical protein
MVNELRWRVCPVVHTFASRSAGGVDNVRNYKWPRGRNTILGREFLEDGYRAGSGSEDEETSSCARTIKRLGAAPT